ncbi:hypothetical protein UFOVP236_61 [uncultured Caudovirales phage]|uniref:Uncharacterized protein n=1 Tax=uncultured Caudovirales phage TaxID=2100421 RepID=A0A6J7WZL6_9CAUD|nr:hypothetical protein UFOVP236_61 [uncultured Caudovirales phage]
MSITQYEQDGFRVEVGICFDPPNPREWDNVGKVALVNRCRYNFGDELLDADEIKIILTSRSHYIALPIYMYDHSGITINTTGFSCPWDSGIVGVIYVDKARAVKEWGNRYCSKGVRRKAKECLRAEINELDKFVSGQVYEWTVFNSRNEWVDSCGGFYCSIDETLAEGKAALEFCVQQQTKRAA